MPYGHRPDESPIVNAVRLYEAGTPASEVCAPLGVSVRSLYRWCARLGRGRPQLQERMAQLQIENRKLRREVESLRAALDKATDGSNNLRSARERNVSDAKPAFSPASSPFGSKSPSSKPTRADQRA